MCQITITKNQYFGKHRENSQSFSNILPTLVRGKVCGEIIKNVYSVASFVSVVFVFMATIGLLLIVVIYRILYTHCKVFDIVNYFNLINKTIQYVFSNGENNSCGNVDKFTLLAFFFEFSFSSFLLEKQSRVKNSKTV